MTGAPMSMPMLALAIFVAVFAIATIRNIHLGVLMLPAAFAVGVGLAGMPVTGGDIDGVYTKGILDGFPVHILILIGGVTYFFGIAQANGTIDVLIHKLLAAIGDRRALLPFLIFLMTAGIASMGSSQAGYVMIPLAMAAARRSAVDPMLMGVALNSGMSAGGFAPISLFGFFTVTTAREAGIALNSSTLLGAAVVANLALLCVAAWMFRGPGTATLPRESSRQTAVTSPRAQFGLQQVVTLICIGVLVLTVIVLFWRVFQPDPDTANTAAAAIGLIAFGLGAGLAWVWPESGAEGLRRIDWSTIFMVGAIVTFVAVLKYLKADTILGQEADAVAKALGTPLVGVFLICAIAGLVSAFASTTGIITTLVPMAVPLAMSGGVAGWALMCALGVCASIVDASPYSTTGALTLASAAESERPRLKSLLMRWGLWMVVVGPVAAVILLGLIGPD